MPTQHSKFAHNGASGQSMKQTMLNLKAKFNDIKDREGEIVIAIKNVGCKLGNVTAGERGIRLKKGCLITYGFMLGKDLKYSEAKTFKLMMSEVNEKNKIKYGKARKLRDELFHELGVCV